MSARLIDLLARLAPRERGLIGLLVFAILPAALWFGALVPLQERRDAAEASLTEARALQSWVTSRAAEMATLAATDNTGPRAPIGLSALEQSLIEADLRSALAGLANRSGGGIELRFDVVDFAQLMEWLSAQDPAWGYDITSLRLDSGEEPGLVAAELLLAPQS
ncbi:MAG: type II secretion system protein GspM [Paracoccaceae bacterium]|nr:type II secretion system protein GspM [Paracoccaceae bacterium]